MKSLKLILGAALTAGVAAAASSPAQAQYPPGQFGGPNTQLIEARKAIQAAEKDVVRIRQDMVKVKARVQSRYETKDEWEEAQKNLKAAQTASDGARRRAMAKLLADPNYKAAKAKLTKADQQLLAAQAAGGSDIRKLEAAQQARIDAGLVIRKLETEAMANDPKVVEAKEKLAEAKQGWEALQDELKQVLEQDPEYQTAQQELEMAQANVLQMRQQLQQQQAQEAAARRAAAQAERASRRTGGAGRSGGRAY